MTTSAAATGSRVNGATAYAASGGQMKFGAASGFQVGSG